MVRGGGGARASVEVLNAEDNDGGCSTGLEERWETWAAREMSIIRLLWQETGTFHSLKILTQSLLIRHLCEMQM